VSENIQFALKYVFLKYIISVISSIFKSVLLSQRK